MSKPLDVGDSQTVPLRFSQEDVISFARISGDANPLHLDAEYAATTIFKRPIMHGMLSASVFSRVLGTEFPGPGTIYLSQSLQFKAPMYVETNYIARLTIRSIQGHRAIIDTVIEDEAGKITLQGEAEVMNRERIKQLEIDDE